MAPEAMRGDVSVKVDVFSFGAVVLEVVTGLKPIDEDRESRDIVSLTLFFYLSRKASFVFDPNAV